MSIYNLNSFSTISLAYVDSCDDIDYDSMRVISQGYDENLNEVEKKSSFQNRTESKRIGEVLESREKDEESYRKISFQSINSSSRDLEFKNDMSIIRVEEILMRNGEIRPKKKAEKRISCLKKDNFSEFESTLLSEEQEDSLKNDIASLIIRAVLFLMKKNPEKIQGKIPDDINAEISELGKLEPGSKEEILEEFYRLILRQIKNLMNYEEKIIESEFFEPLIQSLKLMSQIILMKHDIDFKRLKQIYLIAKGGQASVFRAYDYCTKKSYAKRLFNIQNDRNMRDALKEISILITIAKQNDSSLLEIFSIILDNNSLTVYSDYGLGDLKFFIKFLDSFRFKLTINERNFIMKKIKDQFISLQKLNIYHRDIKPSNIIIDENFTFKFIDFGLAETIEHKFFKNRTYITCGTPGFWHPEIEKAFKKNLRTIKIDLEEADLYSINKVSEILERVTDTTIKNDLDQFELVNSLGHKFKQDFMSYQNSQLVLNFSGIFEENDPINQMENSFLYRECIEWIDKKIEMVDDDIEKINLNFKKARMYEHMEKNEEIIILEEICEKYLAKITDETIEKSIFYSEDYKWYKIASDAQDKLSYKSFVKNKLEIELLTVKLSREYNLREKESILLSLLEKQRSLSDLPKNFEDNAGKLLRLNYTFLASTYHNIAQVYSNQARYEEALEFYSKSLDINIKIFGSDYTSVANIYHDIGQVHSHQASYEKALEFYYKSLDINLKIFGSYHTSVAITYHDIGQVYSDQARYEEALDYYTKSLEINTKILGSYHTSIAAIYHSIAQLYTYQARYLEALDNYKRSLQIDTKILGSNNTSVAATYDNIGQVYFHQARYEEALEYYHKSLDIKIKILGSYHTSVATTYHNIAQVYFHQARYEEALEYYNKSLDITMKILGSNHKSVAEAYQSIAQVYSDEARYEEALEYYQKSLDIAIKVLGSKHTSVATTYDNIAQVYSHQTRYEEALEYYQKSLDIKIRILGSNHTSLANTYNNIAGVYSGQARYEEALEYYHKSLDITIKLLGSNHTSVATTYHNIAAVYSDQARYEEALEYYHKSLDIDIKILGSNHTSVATTYNNIARVYSNQARYEEALEYYHKSLDIAIKILGSKHTSVATTYNNIGEVYSHQARYEEALEYYYKSLEIKIRILGSNHPSVANTYNNIAGVYSGQARYEEALEYYHKSLDIDIKILGSNHTSVATNYQNIAVVYSHQARYEEALEYYHKSLDITIKLLGSNHTSVATTYHNIAAVYSDQARYEEALEYYHKSLDIDIKILGSNHTSVAMIFNNIARVYSDQARYEEALEYYHKSLDIAIKILGSKHTSVATTYDNIGEVYSHQARYEEALEYYYKSLEIKISILGSNHTSVANTYNNIAGVYSGQARYEEALEYYHKSLDIDIKILGSNHISVATTFHNIGQVKSNQARYEEALEYFHKSLDIKIKIYGENHISVATTYHAIAQVYSHQVRNEKAFDYYNKFLEIKCRMFGSREPWNCSISNTQIENIPAKLSIFLLKSFLKIDPLPIINSLNHFALLWTLYMMLIENKQFEIALAACLSDKDFIDNFKISNDLSEILIFLNQNIAKLINQRDKEAFKLLKGRNDVTLTEIETLSEAADILFSNEQYLSARNLYLVVEFYMSFDYHKNLEDSFASIARKIYTRYPFTIKKAHAYYNLE